MQFGRSLQKQGWFRSTKLKDFSSFLVQILREMGCQDLMLTLLHKFSHFWKRKTWTKQKVIWKFCLWNNFSALRICQTFLCLCSICPLVSLKSCPRSADTWLPSCTSSFLLNSEAFPFSWARFPLLSCVLSSTRNLFEGSSLLSVPLTPAFVESWLASVSVPFVLGSCDGAGSSSSTFWVLGFKKAFLLKPFLPIETA